MNGYECACMEHNWLCSTRTGRLRCDGMWTVGCWFSRYVRQTDLTGRSSIVSHTAGWWACPTYIIGGEIRWGPCYCS